MEKKPKKKQNNRARAYLARFTGMSLISLSTVAGVGVYTFSPEINGAQDFSDALQDFQLLQEGMKLNMAVAFPFIAALIVFLLIVLRKNRDFFKDKASVGLIIAISFMYLVYSVIGLFMSACIGALPAVMAHEFGFEPAYRRRMRLFEIEKELKLEEQKEEIRVEVRERRRR